MATIRSVFAPGQTFSVLDPNAWVGGVVPGPNDLAQIGENGNYRTAINMSSPYNTLEPPTKNGGAYIFPWTDNETTIRVDDNNTNYNSEYEFPDTSGSFLVYIGPEYPRFKFPVKIDYISKSMDNDDYFYSCSVDYSYGSNWTYKTGSTTYNSNITPLGYYSESMGYIHDNNYVYPLETKFELTGSATWSVGQIETLERCHLTLKENAYLLLDGSSQNPNAIYNNSDSDRNVIRILDNTTVQLTGSNNRNNAGFYYNNKDSYNRLQISGSSNCVNTTLNSSTNIGDNKLTLTNSTGFGEGDIISIDHTDYPSYYKFHHVRTGSRENEPGKTSNYYNYGGLDLTFSSGNLFGHDLYIGYSSFDHDFEDIEVVQIISQSGNESTVAQLYGKEGFVYEDLGLYNHEQFVQTFGGVPPGFTGNKRVVLTNSAHKNFKAGDNLIISRSLVTNILYQDYYLSASTVYDFTNDATIDDTFHMPEYRLTGSFLPPTSSWYMNATQQSGNNIQYGKERFDLNNNILVSERAHSLNGAVTRSAHLRSQDTEIASANAPQTSWTAFVTNSYDFHEGEVEVEYAFYKYRYGSVTQSYSNFDTSTRFSLSLGSGRGAGCSIASPVNGNPTVPGTIENMLGFHHYQEQLTIYGNDRNGHTYRQYALTGSQEYDINTTNNNTRYPALYGENSKVKLTHKEGISEIYYNDLLINKITGNVDAGPIYIGGVRYLSIYNIKVSKYYQLLLLDTDESVNKNDSILEGALLKRNHSVGQRVRSNASKIKNALGHTNLLHDYLKNPETNIRPYLHGQTTTQNEGEGNYYNFYRQIAGSGGGNLAIPGPQQYGTSPTYRKTGTGYYMVWDLQTEISMSAVSFQDYLAYNYDYMERAGEPVQVEISNDINADNPWTIVYASANDPRLTSRMGQQRYYHFTSGSAPARFVKLSLNGNSRETSNQISKIGVHNFYDSASNDLGNSIELYNAGNFNVGDVVTFFNYKNATPRVTNNNDDSDGIGNLEREKIVPNIIGNNLTDDDVCGGLSYKFKIIAKNGNRITLDRTAAQWIIDKDTVVYKWNQGGVNFRGDYNNFFNFIIYRSGDDSHNPSQIKNANFDFIHDFRAQRAYQNNHFRSDFREVSIDCRTNNTVFVGADIASNNIVLGGSRHYLQYYNIDTQRRDYFDSISYNNILNSANSDLIIIDATVLEHSNNKIYTLYDSVYRNRENASYMLRNSTENTRGIAINTPDIKINNSYMAGSSRNPLFFNLYSLSYNDRITSKNIEMKDNYIGYGVSAQSDARRMGGYQDRAFSQIQNNPNISINPIPVQYNLFSNSLLFNWVSLSGRMPSGRFDSFFIPIKRYDYIRNSDFVAWGSAEQGSQTLYKSKNTPNRYSLQNASSTGANQSIRNKGPYTGYVCQFMLDTDQNIQISLNFNYKMNSLGQYFGTAQTSRSAYKSRMDEYFWIPKVVLMDSNRMILDSEGLDFTQSDTPFSYNKTFSLQKGFYSFFLNKINNNSPNGHPGDEWLEHGPINLQLYTNDPNPNNISPVNNNWNAYKILEGENVYSKNINTRVGSSINAFIHPSSGNISSNVKFRKVKI